MIHPVEPKKVLCIHDLSGMGRCSLAVILPVLSIMGVQPVALPTVVLSTHTGGLGTPARLDGCAYGEQALEHYHALGVEFDCIYTGYLGGEDQVALAEKAFALWPAAKKIVDPVMGDNGKAYSTVTPALIDRIRALCGAADLILPNYTEAQILLQRQPQTELLTDEAAQALADELTALAPGAVVTGLPLGKYIGCAGSGKDRFLIKKLHISRSFPGTGVCDTAYHASRFPQQTGKALLEYAALNGSRRSNARDALPQRHGQLTQRTTRLSHKAACELSGPAVGEQPAEISEGRADAAQPLRGLAVSDCAPQDAPRALVAGQQPRRSRRRAQKSCGSLDAVSTDQTGDCRPQRRAEAVASRCAPERRENPCARRARTLAALE